VLSTHDESLLHQAPLTLSESVSSDHRFYDRCFITVADPGGSATLAFSMGVYKNMNVIDGFAALALGSRQYNVSVTRPLRPELEPGVGGLSLGVVEPLREQRLMLDPARHPIGFDLRWCARGPAMCESRWWGTQNRVNERIATEVQRYEQTG